jgi:hypothetical protein
LRGDYVPDGVATRLIVSSHFGENFIKPRWVIPSGLFFGLAGPACAESCFCHSGLRAGIQNWFLFQIKSNGFAFCGDLLSCTRKEAKNFLLALKAFGYPCEFLKTGGARTRPLGSDKLAPLSCFEKFPTALKEQRVPPEKSRKRQIK